MENRHARVLISAVMLLLLIILSCAAFCAQTLDVICTHDLHSNLLPLKTAEGNQLGGFARISTLIKQTPGALVVDGGDFSMGTLFQSVFSSDAAELRLLGEMGFDVTTFGNHDFDFRSKGLAGMLGAAADSGDRLPAIVASNLNFPLNMNDDVKALKAAMERAGVSKYTVIEKNGVRIGVFGLIGRDAVECAPTLELKAEDMISASKAVVKLLQQEGVDIIVCLSHSGTWPDESKSEDELLAKAVPEIDLLISGHTHSKLFKTIGDTALISVGEYGQNIGKLRLTRRESGRWTVAEYTIMPVNSGVAEDEVIAKRIDEFKHIVDRKYLARFDYTFDQKLTSSRFNLETLPELNEYAEAKLGNLIADSYVYAVKKSEGSAYEPVAAAVVPNGIIRNTVFQGDVTVADAFNISSLGVGIDGFAGYPLVSIYLTGKELKNLSELDASIAPMSKTLQLYTAGVRYEVNTKRMIFNKVMRFELANADGSFSEPDDNALYRVVADLYSMQRIGAVKKESHGILSIEPKDKNGAVVTDFDKVILYDGGKAEMKAWIALAGYLESFGQDGIPSKYNELMSRKIVVSSLSPSLLFKNANIFTWCVLAASVIVLLLVIFVVFRIVRLFRKKDSLPQRDAITDVSYSVLDEGGKADKALAKRKNRHDDD